MRRGMPAATVLMGAGAALAQAPTEAAPERLQGTAWRVYYGFDAQGLGSSYTVQFDADGYARGPAVCTLFAIPYRQQGDRLTFGRPITEASPSCTGPTADRDRRFIAALRSVRRLGFQPPPASPGWSGPLLALVGSGGRAVLQRATPYAPRDKTRDERPVPLSCDRVADVQHPMARWSGADALLLVWGRVGRAELRRSTADPNRWEGDGHVFHVRGDAADWTGASRDGSTARCTARTGDLTGGGPTDLRTVGRAPAHRLELRVGRGLLHVRRGGEPPTVYTVSRAAPSGRSTTFQLRAAGRAAGTLTVRAAPCNDVLTGREYSSEATLRLGREILRSCGEGKLDR